MSNIKGSQRLTQRIVPIVLGTIGLALIGSVSWRIAIGVFLVMWGDNWVRGTRRYDDEMRMVRIARAQQRGSMPKYDS